MYSKNNASDSSGLRVVTLTGVRLHRYRTTDPTQILHYEIDPAVKTSPTPNPSNMAAWSVTLPGFESRVRPNVKVALF